MPETTADPAPEPATDKATDKATDQATDPATDRAMRRATALGEAARRVTPPWPWVGCVLVRDGRVVGEGATGPFREGVHAEVAALAAAGDAARGATAVVTLEPCDHHGNTPPCTDALIAAGVTSAVVAIEDPDARVAGRGLRRLEAAGVGLHVGVGAAAVRRSLAPYLHHRRTGRPLVVLKTAMSLDARTAAADGSSRWITGADARRDAHRLRAESQAVIVGAGTALADRPSLTVRDAPAAPVPPRRVLLDATGRVPASGPLFDADLGPTLVCTTAAVDPAARRQWEAAGAQVAVLPAPAAAAAAGVDPTAVLDLLGSEGALQVLVEGGSALHRGFLAAGAADRVVCYVAPLLLGSGGLAAFAGEGPGALAGARRWCLTDVARVGDDVRLTYEPGAAEAA
jgi:diaminohydroxyphosphoribosylaminopyrimidine deaminase/5-amino-6-(5-phosphoribosylamino)uracil reductase